MRVHHEHVQFVQWNGIALFESHQQPFLYHPVLVRSVIELVSLLAQPDSTGEVFIDAGEEVLQRQGIGVVYHKRSLGKVCLQPSHQLERQQPQRRQGCALYSILSSILRHEQRSTSETRPLRRLSTVHHTEDVPSGDAGNLSELLIRNAWLREHVPEEANQGHRVSVRFQRKPEGVRLHRWHNFTDQCQREHDGCIGEEGFSVVICVQRSQRRFQGRWEHRCVAGERDGHSQRLVQLRRHGRKRAARICSDGRWDACPQFHPLNRRRARPTKVQRHGKLTTTRGIVRWVVHKTLVRDLIQPLRNMHPKLQLVSWRAIPSRSVSSDLVEQLLALLLHPFVVRLLGVDGASDLRRGVGAQIADAEVPFMVMTDDETFDRFGVGEERPDSHSDQNALRAGRPSKRKARDRRVYQNLVVRCCYNDVRSFASGHVQRVPADGDGVIVQSRLRRQRSLRTDREEGPLPKSYNVHGRCPSPPR
eukprot:scaffold650_cov249-Pinguiococcus_pyrenoidosus.AAC.3